MKKEFATAGAKFVYSKNELGYQEVLDNFPEASEITIITYNISEKREALVRALRSASEHCSINVITNIPSRWETYYGDTRSFFFSAGAFTCCNFVIVFKLSPPCQCHILPLSALIIQLYRA